MGRADAGADVWALGAETVKVEALRANGFVPRGVGAVAVHAGDVRRRYDAHSASGELEPVGTAPPYRRQGYGAAACLAALHRLRDLGARHALVYAVDDPANPGPKALYESIGSAVAGRHVRYSPPTRHNAAKPGER